MLPASPQLRPRNYCFYPTDQGHPVPIDDHDSEKLHQNDQAPAGAQHDRSQLSR